MAIILDHITHEQADLIRSSHVFFVASADPSLAEGPDGQGAVNLSPKGAADLHVIDRNTLAYFDYAGSGNETARHGMAGGPVTGHGHLVRRGRRHRSPLRARLRETP